MHEVERPDMVRKDRRHQWLFRHLGKPFLGSSGHIELHVLVYPPDFLVVPEVSLVPESVETESEAPAAMLGNDRVERINDGGIFDRLVDRFPVVRRPRQGYAGTGLLHGQLFFLNQIIHGRPFLDGR